jgi:hypothetical protein
MVVFVPRLVDRSRVDVRVIRSLIICWFLFIATEQHVVCSIYWLLDRTRPCGSAR